ncbi:hypothetical protein CLU79DRAFT_65757 [Phycomyces nitens]|nr:hypothetical protein CLU79DRAFT_65757 [Phycomyces nitens]
MTTIKATQIAKDIDSCRCKGNWEAIPELARRYRKHNPDGAVLEKTILAEASLANLIGNSYESTSFSADSPTHTTLPPRLSTNQVRPIQSQLEAVLQMSASPETQLTKELAKVILARSYHESGEFSKALEYVDQLNFQKPDAKAGYNFILFLQARAIKAICLELTGNVEDALVSYQEVASVIDDHEGQREPAFVECGEDALYRGTLLGLREMT